MIKRLSTTLFRILLLLALPTSATWSESEPVFQVFVSVEPLRYLTERVGGPHVTVETMIAPGENPATYAPSPRKMARLHHAAMLVYVGVPSERTWLPRIRRNHPDVRLVDARKGIPPRRHQHDGHDDIDPHLWTSPITSLRMAATIRDALIDIDPLHRADYERGYRRLATTLETLDREIAARLAGLPQRRFMVFHPAWGYFAERYGLEQIAIERGGKSPGMRHLSRLIDEARGAGIRTIIVQPQFSRRDAETIAAEIGARVVAIDPLAYDIPATLRRLTEALSRP